MNTDKLTKLLLAIIALGLWLNLAGSWFRPQTAAAQSRNPIVDMAILEGELRAIQANIDLTRSKVDDIATRRCANKKICEGTLLNR